MFFLNGDLNSRTSNELDYIVFDRFLSLQSNVYISPRVNKDRVLDAHGKRLINLCKSTNLLIGNGRLHDDKNIEDFTFLIRMVRA